MGQFSLSLDRKSIPLFLKIWYELLLVVVLLVGVLQDSSPLSEEVAPADAADNVGVPAAFGGGGRRPLTTTTTTKSDGTSRGGGAAAAPPGGGEHYYENGGGSSTEESEERDGSSAACMPGCTPFAVIRRLPRRSKPVLLFGKQQRRSVSEGVLVAASPSAAGEEKKEEGLARVVDEGDDETSAKKKKNDEVSSTFDTLLEKMTPSVPSTTDKNDDEQKKNSSEASNRTLRLLAEVQHNNKNQAAAVAANPRASGLASLPSKRVNALGAGVQFHSSTRPYSLYDHGSIVATADFGIEVIKKQHAAKLGRDPNADIGGWKQSSPFIIGDGVFVFERPVQYDMKLPPGFGRDGQDGRVKEVQKVYLTKGGIGLEYRTQMDCLPTWTGGDKATIVVRLAMASDNNDITAERSDTAGDSALLASAARMGMMNAVTRRVGTFEVEWSSPVNAISRNLIYTAGGREARSTASHALAISETWMKISRSKKEHATDQLETDNKMLVQPEGGNAQEERQQEMGVVVAPSQQQQRINSSRDLLLSALIVLVVVELVVLLRLSVRIDELLLLR
ncbi:hypothetical protein NFJ02_04g114890 [Pycnococcus provasolii]